MIYLISGSFIHYGIHIYSCTGCTLGGIASICFKFHFQQTLRTHTQGCQGCQKIRNFVRNSKILIARSTIHPILSKIKNHYWKTSKIDAFFNGFWFCSILAGWSTWQWVFLNSSINFWSFDTPDTPRCASAVIWNRFEPFLLQCNPLPLIGGQHNCLH